MDRSHEQSSPATPAQPSRRDAIGAAILGALGLSRLANAQSVGAAPATPARVVRIAHLTDVHLQPERGAEAGFAACLAHMQSQPDRPELVLTGGDHLMDVFEQQAPRSATLATMWRDVMKRECSLRVESAIGNHDIRGWHSKAGMRPEEPGYGKAFALDLLGLAEPYRTFDLAANGATWQVIVLDSIQQRPDSYRCYCDQEQRAWLEKTLKAKPKDRPTLVLSHAPILSLTPFSAGDRRKGDDLTVDGSLLHLDGAALHQLFRRNNVKLCLSGHIHALDRCDIDGVSYICDGAVCGNWWKGPHRDVPEGYGIVDLFADGSFRHTYAQYGWHAQG